MSRIIMYSKEDCCLCEDAKKILRELQNEFIFEIEEVDIYKDDFLLEKYQIMIPVITVNGKELASGIIHKIDIKKYCEHFFNRKG